MYKYIGSVNGVLGTHGTVACAQALKVNLQVTLDGNSSREIAVMPVYSAAGTCSKGNCAAVLTDLGTYEANRPAGAGGNYWIAYRAYDGASIASGTSVNDKYIAEKLG